MSKKPSAQYVLGNSLKGMSNPPFPMGQGITAEAQKIKSQLGEHGPAVLHPQHRKLVI